MTWEEEWAAAKQTAREDMTRTRLNSDEAGNGGSAPGRTDLSVPLDVLRSASSASRDVESDLLPVIDDAIAKAHAAGESLRGWDLGPRLTITADKWGEKLCETSDRLIGHADGLDMLSYGMSETDMEIGRQFRTWGTV
ncbi:hypothetical protein ACFV0Z_06045 [Streptomyces xiamenensis]|uniref:hypothetical protein n=1 Tax=Streptomyces xiamenensis TaxID=408015 RepID=UPI00368F3D3E